MRLPLLPRRRDRTQSAGRLESRTSPMVAVGAIVRSPPGRGWATVRTAAATRELQAASGRPAEPATEERPLDRGRRRVGLVRIRAERNSRGRNDKSGSIGRPVGEHGLLRPSQSVTWRHGGRRRKGRSREGRPSLLVCTDPAWGKLIGTFEKRRSRPALKRVGRRR